MRKLSLEIFSGIDESKTNESDTSCTLGTDEPGCHLKHKWIEESVSLIVMSIVLAIKCCFNFEDIRLRILGDGNTDFFIA